MGDTSSIKNTNTIGESNTETSTSRREQLHTMLEGALGSPECILSTTDKRRDEISSNPL